MIQTIDRRSIYGCQNVTVKVIFTCVTYGEKVKFVIFDKQYV